MLPPAKPDPPPGQSVAREFRTTHWSVVLRAGGTDPATSRRALEELCRAYWYPLYSFVRRSGHSPEDAQDLTQGYFARLLAGPSLASVHPDKGRFRAFLLASLKHFLANEWKRAQCQKRGGGVPLLSLDEQNPEGRYLHEPVDDLTPERAFERRWAEALLAKVLARLRAEFIAARQADRYEALKHCLLNDREAASDETLAGRLGLTVHGIKSAVHRMRQRYGEIFREEIADTVAAPGDVEDEIRHLFQVLSG